MYLVTAFISAITITAVSASANLTQFSTSKPPPVAPSGNDESWCGKHYKSGSPATIPSGLIPDPVLSDGPLLDLKIRPRMHPYIADDTTGIFLVDTTISHIHGDPIVLGICTASAASVSLSNEQMAAQIAEGTNLTANCNLQIVITRLDTNKQIASASIAINMNNTQIQFDLGSFAPTTIPYKIRIQASLKSSSTVFSASTSLHRLPNPREGGVTKIDNLYGALLVKSQGAWQPVLPYSYYVGTDYMTNHDSMEEFAAKGYNVMHIIPGGAPSLADMQALESVFQHAAKLGLWIMWDMRHSWQDRASVTLQVKYLKSHSNFLLWYTSDEADGFEYPLAEPKKSHDLIKSLDPYHPISLALNCQNYHFNEYAAGGDILLAGGYMIGANTTFSTVWHTPVNKTFGNCGCDNCYGDEDLNNLGSRISDYQRYQVQLGLAQKPLWGTVQSIPQQDYWTRSPTGAEVVALALISFNNGATGLLMWAYHDVPETEGATSQLANALIKKKCAQYILGAEILRSFVVQGSSALSIAGWKVDDKLLLSIVNTANTAVTGSLRITMPAGIVASQIESPAILGDGEWTLGQDGSVLQRNGLESYDAALIILDLESTSTQNSSSRQAVAHGVVKEVAGSIATS